MMESWQQTKIKAGENPGKTLGNYCDGTGHQLTHSEVLPAGSLGVKIQNRLDLWVKLDFNSMNSEKLKCNCGILCSNLDVCKTEDCLS